MPTELYEHYLCAYCNRISRAPAGSVDRTREWRCLSCRISTPAIWDDETMQERLGWMTA
jgi:DNA-directed RNA polymerase subunit RPC12/RpoP